MNLCLLKDIKCDVMVNILTRPRSSPFRSSRVERAWIEILPITLRTPRSLTPLPVICIGISGCTAALWVVSSWELSEEY